MIGERPDFLDSTYFVMELNNWHLKPGAPEETIQEFEQFMRLLQLMDTGGGRNDRGKDTGTFKRK